MGMPTYGSERPQPRKSAPKSLRKASGQFDTKKFGAAVRKLREDRNIGPSEFSSLAGLTRESLRVLENGSVAPSISSIEKVAALLGLTVTEAVALGVKSAEPIAPAMRSAISLLQDLDRQDLELAISILRALGKYRRT